MKIYIFILIIISCNSIIHAQPYALIETESPYALKPYILEGKLLFGYETGHIPDYLIKPQLNFGIFSWFQVGGAFSTVHFINQDEWRIAEYELKAKARLLQFKANDFSLFTYFKYRRATGSPIIASYSGDLENVTAVVSPRADAGTDYTGGLCTRFLLHNFKKPLFVNNLALLLNAEYARTEGRDYFSVSIADEEGYRNRLTFSITPALFFGPSKTSRNGSYTRPVFKKNTVMFAIENKYTYWDKLGYMYDMVPQINWSVSNKSSVYGGVSIPVIGGKVYKFYVGVSTQIDINWITADLAVGPRLFSPDNNGVNDTLLIEPSVRSRHTIRRWKVVIYDPSNKPFRIFYGRGALPKKIKWNGKSRRGELVESAQHYKVKLEAWDVKGNRDRTWASFRTDIMFVDNISRIILFDFNRAYLSKKGYRVLYKLTALLATRFKKYHIVIRGHTCKIGSKTENLKLSKKRALTVQRYLIQHGINKHRIRYAAFGESKPIASNSTVTGRRKNRRVEFVLIKK